MSDRRWWASHYEHRVGPFPTREEAAAQFFKDYPLEDEAMTGYGTYASHFDIQWIKRGRR